MPRCPLDQSSKRRSRRRLRHVVRRCIVLLVDPNAPEGEKARALRTLYGMPVTLPTLRRTQVGIHVGWMARQTGYLARLAGILIQVWRKLVREGSRCVPARRRCSSRLPSVSVRTRWSVGWPRSQLRPLGEDAMRPLGRSACRQLEVGPWLTGTQLTRALQRYVSTRAQSLVSKIIRREYCCFRHNATPCAQ